MLSDTQLTKGAIGPLLFIRRFKTTRRIRRFFLFSLIACLLAGCRGTPPEPTLNATGYLDNKGSVRIWRKDLNHIPIAIISDYVPYNNDEEQIVTTYEYVDGTLSQIKRQILAEPEVSEQLRFDADAKLTFNQRVFPDRKEMIDAAAVDALTYQARRILEMSSVLQAGNVRLIQGHYRQGLLTTCNGEQANLDLEPSKQAWLNEQLKERSSANLAWLVSSVGEELILLTQKEICASEPTLDSL